jgi:hypothetical protein
MDLRVYYEKLRKIESEIQDPFPVVISRETTDGGKQGLKTQVSRSLAARLIVDGKVDLATKAEAAQFVTHTAKQWRAASEEAALVAPSKPMRIRAKASKKS